MRLHSASFAIVVAALVAPHIAAQPQPSSPAQTPAPGPPPETPTPPPTAPPTPPPAPSRPANAAPPVSAPSSPPVSVHPDTLQRPGYIPGYRTYPWFGLPPHVPHSASPSGGLAVPYGAPAPLDSFTFHYTGFFAAGVRASLRARELSNVSLAPYQSELVLRNAVDNGGPFSAGGTQGSWVQFNFEYGNRIATAHVTIDTWNPSRGASFTQLGSQNFVDSAYMLVRVPPFGKLKLGFTIGAFSVTYGPLGQNGGGFYTNSVAQISGVGETTAAEYALSDTLVVTAQHGIHGTGDKAPAGSPSRASERAPSALGDPYDPSAWTHHLHAGLIRNGEVTLFGELHYLHNWSMDERGLLPPQTPPLSGSLANYDTDPRPETPSRVGDRTGVDESIRKDDGVYDAYGVNVGFKGNWFRGGADFVYGRAKNAYSLHGLRISYVGDGDVFSNDWIGPRSIDRHDNWAGSLWSTAFEAEFSWGTLWRAPEPFWGEGFNITTAVGAQYGRIASEDPARDGWAMYRAGIDVFASLLPWLAAELRVDQVNPNLDRTEQLYHALMTRLVFRTDWHSHEQVSLQYNKWIYGSEPPVNYRAPPVEKLDTDVVSFGFGMWW